MTEKLDPGGYIGHEPEREAESIPGGIEPADERVSAYASRPGVDGEPDAGGVAETTTEDGEGDE